MDGMQRQEDFTNINATWSSLDCVIYTSTVEAGISFEIPNHFDAIIGISNIKTGVHVEAFAQMLYRIRDCPQCIISLYNSQKSSEIFQEPNRSLIRAELSALRPIDLPTAIKGIGNGIKLLIVMLLMYLQQSKHILRLNTRDAYQQSTFLKFFAVLFLVRELHLKLFLQKVL